MYEIAESLKYHTFAWNIWRRYLFLYDFRKSKWRILAWIYL